MSSRWDILPNGWGKWQVRLFSVHLHFWFVFIHYHYQKKILLAVKKNHMCTRMKEFSEWSLRFTTLNRIWVWTFFKRQAHMIQSGQMLPQQQMMMQASQPIHMPPCKKFLLLFCWNVSKCQNHACHIFIYLRNGEFLQAVHATHFRLR